MNKVIIELHEGANFEEALKTLEQLPFVSDLKFIQTNGQNFYDSANNMKAPNNDKQIKDWSNALENDDFWKNS